MYWDRVSVSKQDFEAGSALAELNKHWAKSYHRSQSQVGFSNNPSACASCTATHPAVKYLLMYEVRRAGHRALARVSGSLPL